MSLLRKEHGPTVARQPDGRIQRDCSAQLPIYSHETTTRGLHRAVREGSGRASGWRPARCASTCGVIVVRATYSDLLAFTTRSPSEVCRGTIACVARGSPGSALLEDTRTR